MKDQMKTQNTGTDGAGMSFLEKYLLEGAKAWRLSSALVLVIVLLPFAVAGVGVLTALLGKDVYKSFTGEDGIAEYLQVILYTLALLLSIIVAYRQFKRGQRLIAVLYLGLGLALFFLVGEELSWGQRIVGWETTEFFSETNKQEETNLHNLYGIGDAFKWVQFMIGAYGTLLPLILLRWPVSSKYAEFSAAVVPHYTLVTYFLLLFVWRIYRNLFEAPSAYYFVISEFNEVLETILAIGFVLFMVFQLRRESGQEPILVL